MIGKINVKRRQETSCNGLPAALLKSAIQKYARRALAEKGLWCLAEMDLFSLVEADPEGAAEHARLRPRAAGTSEAEARATAVRRARALRTNLLNRLIVMVSEEISIAAWWMPLVVHQLAAAWQDNRGKTASRKYLVDISRHLLATKKVRLISYLKSVYLLPPDYVKPDRRRDLVG
jgi:hypothetical protein